jgi:uncharacterized RDD family membrane protein YckC
LVGTSPLAVGLPIESLEEFQIDGWPGGAVVYVVGSVVMLGWYGGWQAGVGGTPGMLVLRLRVLDASGLGSPSFGAAVIRNSPQVLAMLLNALRPT